VYGISVDGIGKVKIKVPEEFSEEAKRIIGQSDKGRESNQN